MRGDRKEHRAARNETVRYPDYHDHLDRSDDWVDQRRQELGVGVGRKKKFPIQLHRMLESVDGTGHSLVVRWLPHGRAFVVLDKKRFEKEVLPMYFPDQHDIASFQRQLSNYSFLRLVQGESYYHELFLRGRSGTALLIPRTTAGRYSSRRRYDQSTEPDLYAMPRLPDSVTALSDDAASPNPTPGAFIPPSSRMQRPELKPPPKVTGRVTLAPLSTDETITVTSPVDASFTFQNLLTASEQLASRYASYDRLAEPNVAPLFVPPWPLSGTTNRDSHADRTCDHVTQQRPLLRPNHLSAGTKDLWLHHIAVPPGPDATRLKTDYVGPRSFGLLRDVLSCDKGSTNQNIEPRLDHMETSSDSDNGGNLAEWAHFLEDVDLDASSSSGGEQMEDV